MRILPGVLKELSKHVPSVLFQTIDWSELASELPKISRRMLQKEGHADLCRLQMGIVKDENIVISDRSFTEKELRKDKWTGEKWLSLYFHQLYSPHGLFLDLRSAHFKDDRPTLTWSPNGLWVKFDEKFRQGLLKVYEGFYLQNDELYYSGLEEIGLLNKDLSQIEKEELGHLFRKQFGSALDQEMEFKLDHLRDSIIGMSHFMLDKRIKISKDFLYLGIYLVTLYSSLEETKESYPVKQIYLKSKAKFSP